MMNNTSLTRLTLALCLVLLASVAHGEDVCQDYVTWLRTHPTGEADPNVQYREDLIHNGMSVAEADARIEALWKSMLDCPEGAALSFDRVYRWKKLPFTSEPNAFLVEAAHDIKPGRALDVAMGQGRNSIYLAKKGWTVTGFDVSEEGLAMARKAAEGAGVKIDMVHQGWKDFNFGTEKWDLIVLTYAWVPINNPDFIHRLCLSLRPGGFIIFEGAITDASTHPNEALKAFQKELRILQYQDVEAVSDWNNQRKLPTARLLATK